MPRYTSDSRERVRDAIDFVELVNARTELRKSGQRRYTGLCPFHDERTPSFGIDPVEKLYHCFGCGEGGDVFKFVMETEGLDFGAALESLAAGHPVQGLEAGLVAVRQDQGICKVEEIACDAVGKLMLLPAGEPPLERRDRGVDVAL